MIFAAATALASLLAVAAEPRAKLVGIALYPAASFAPGPPSGQYNDRGERMPEPLTATQPVQGVSSIKPVAGSEDWWALSDNGYALKWNSFDYRLAIYRFRLRPDGPPDGRVALVTRITLKDPQRHFPYRLTEESLPERPLTGADVDPESMVVLPDGTFWISDELGPWLLHFSGDGELLAPPVQVNDPQFGELRSVSHPLVLAGKAVGNVRTSKGFEGLAASADGRRLYALLEGPLTTDRARDAASELRILEFDLARNAFTGRSWRYPLEGPGLMIGELAYWRDGSYLVIERDDLWGEAARVKRIYAVDLEGAAPGDLLKKRLVVDLLDIADPQGLGGARSTFRFPYWTIESVAAIDARTLLVVNDNNYPKTGGRGADTPDATEWIWLRLPR